MAASVPLSTMRTAVREIANQETVTTQFVTDPELDRRINANAHGLYDLLIECNGHEYYVKEHDYTLVVDQGEYDLPLDHYQTLGLLLKYDDWYAEILPWRHQDRARLKNRSVSGSAYWYWYVDALRYRHQGSKIKLLPAPQQAYTMELTYTPVCPELVNDTDSFDGVNGWEEWIYLTTAIDIINKGETNAGPWERALKRIEARIRAHAGHRDHGRPDVIQDTAQDDWADPSNYYGDGYGGW